jgi:hypothetical protein
MQTVSDPFHTVLLHTLLEVLSPYASASDPLRAVSVNAQHCTPVEPQHASAVRMAFVMLGDPYWRPAILTFVLYLLCGFTPDVQEHIGRCNTANVW